MTSCRNCCPWPSGWQHWTGGLATFTVGLLHGLGRMTDARAAGAPDDGGRLVIRTPESMVRELFG